MILQEFHSLVSVSSSSLCLLKEQLLSLQVSLVMQEEQEDYLVLCSWYTPVLPRNLGCVDGGNLVECKCCALSDEICFGRRVNDDVNRPLTKYCAKLSTTAAVTSRTVKKDNLPCSFSKTSDAQSRERHSNGCVVLWTMQFFLMDASKMMWTWLLPNIMPKLALQRPLQIACSTETISPVLLLKPQMRGRGKGAGMGALCFEQCNSFWCERQWWCEQATHYIVCQN